MAIQYVDLNRQNTTFIPTNKQNLIDNIETVLLAAGWTTISGHATTTLVMQSATTPQGLNMQMKFKDNGGTCVTLSLQNVSGSKVGTNSTTTGVQLNPGASSKTYRMVANKYQAFIWTASVTPGREFAGFGVPYIPVFLVGVIIECMWLQGNGISDTSTTIATSLRTSLQSYTPTAGLFGTQQMLVNGNLWQLDANTNPGSQNGGFCVIPVGMFVVDNLRAYRWHDNSASLIDALVAWGLTSATDEGKIRGQLWDSMLSSESYAGDLTTIADSHNWIALTDLQNGSNVQPRGTLFIATP
jgi:hypothetical protein